MAKLFESPQKKSKRYAGELKRKKDHQGRRLSKSRATYRMGYLNARRDASSARQAVRKGARK